MDSARLILFLLPPSHIIQWFIWEVTIAPFAYSSVQSVSCDKLHNCNLALSELGSNKDVNTFYQICRVLLSAFVSDHKYSAVFLGGGWKHIAPRKHVAVNFTPWLNDRISSCLKASLPRRPWVLGRNARQAVNVCLGGYLKAGWS